MNRRTNGRGDFDDVKVHVKFKLLKPVLNRWLNMIFRVLYTIVILITM